MKNTSLHALLSYAFVAFTIEVDNTAELKLQHRTTRFGGEKGPWLISAAMYWSCLRDLDPGGLSVGELMKRSRSRPHLHGMRRWGYVRVEHDPGQKFDAKNAIVKPTRAGLAAREVFTEAFVEVEDRWRARFATNLKELRSALIALIDRFEYALPNCMPILGYGLTCEGAIVSRKSGPECLGDLPLDALLAKVLLAFALVYEKSSLVSLAICSDVLRIVPQEGAAPKDLPEASGVSKEAIAMALTFLRGQGFGSVDTSENKDKLLHLSEKGVDARAAYPRLVAELDDRWKTKFGKGAIERLMAVLARIAGDGTAQNSPLFQGLEPAPSNWRAKTKRPRVLPDFPMVLHRGGYPDGS